MEAFWIVVGLGVAFFVLRAVFFSSSKPNVAPDVGGRMSQSINMLGKIKATIDLFTNQITHGKEEKNREKYGIYLIGYSYGIVQEMCKFDRIECSDLYLTPVLQEVQRIFGEESDNIIEETRAQLDEIVATKLGAQGLADGLVDGSYVSNPKNPSPYFGKLVSFF